MSSCSSLVDTCELRKPQTSGEEDLLLLVLDINVISLVVILLGRLALGCFALLPLGSLVIVLGGGLSALLGSLLGGRSAFLTLEFLKVLTIREVNRRVRRKQRQSLNATVPMTEITGPYSETQLL